MILSEKCERALRREIRVNEEHSRHPKQKTLLVNFGIE